MHLLHSIKYSAVDLLLRSSKLSESSTVRTVPVQAQTNDFPVLINFCDGWVVRKAGGSGKSVSNKAICPFSALMPFFAVMQLIAMLVVSRSFLSDGWKKGEENRREGCKRKYTTER
jgi:hypothetical protein